MKKYMIVASCVTTTMAIASLILFLVKTSGPNLDDATSWVNVLVDDIEPTKSMGKYHAYYINRNGWGVYRKEFGQWSYKGYIFELENDMFRDNYVVNSQAVYSNYRRIVKKNLGYDYNAGGKNWLRDLCQGRLYERNIYTINFYDYDNTLLWSTTSYLRNSVTYQGPTPTRDGYVFSGWDTDFASIYSNLDVKALYKGVKKYGKF